MYIIVEYERAVMEFACSL